jgi:peptidoglycan hydrolase-like protein with peptidoglycan-binding domain
MEGTMVIFKIGSKGKEVGKIQKKLSLLKHYQGPIDGIFGGGTEAAVKAFQKEKGLVIDGIVGPITWKALFKKKIPTPSIVD